MNTPGLGRWMALSLVFSALAAVPAEAQGGPGCTLPVFPVQTIQVSRSGPDVLLDWAEDGTTATSFVVYNILDLPTATPIPIGTTTSRIFVHAGAALSAEPFRYRVAAVDSCGNESPLAWDTVIRGHVTFEADYQDIDTNIDGIGNPAPWGPPPLAFTEGAIPNGTEGMKRLWVCAYDRDCDGCGVDDDLRFDAHPDNGAQSDDDLIGCARVGSSGYYYIYVRATSVIETAVDPYLVTWFCDGPSETVSIPGGNYEYVPELEFCVSRNMKKEVEPQEGDWPGGPGEDRARTKYSWSRHYTNVDIWGETTSISWNLSCPEEPGLGVNAPMGCGGWTQGWELKTCNGNGYPDCVSNPNGTSSNTTWNKEAAHAFRSLAQSPHYRPSPETTVPGADLFDPDPGKEWVRVYMKEAHDGNPANMSAGGGCNASCAIPNAVENPGSADVVVLASSNLASPTAPLHELGHIIHARWMNAVLGPGGCATPSGFGAGAGADEGPRVAEGFADFWGTAGWFSRFEHDPVFYSRRRWVMEDASASLLAPCPAVDGEGREAQFFWDLYDASGYLDPDDEIAAYSLVDILKTWSRFSVPGVPDNRSTCDGISCGVLCQGRNINDFLYHLNEIAPADWDEWQDAREHNCVTAYSDPFQ